MIRSSFPLPILTHLCHRWSESARLSAYDELRSLRPRERGRRHLNGLARPCLPCRVRRCILPPGFRHAANIHRSAACSFISDLYSQTRRASCTKKCGSASCRFASAFPGSQPKMRELVGNPAEEMWRASCHQRKRPPLRGGLVQSRFTRGCRMVFSAIVM